MASFRAIIEAAIPIVSSHLDLPHPVVRQVQSRSYHPVMRRLGWCGSEGGMSLFEGGPLDQVRYDSRSHQL